MVLKHWSSYGGNNNWPVEVRECSHSAGLFNKKLVILLILVHDVTKVLELGLVNWKINDYFAIEGKLYG